jgi:hypothetical protein
MLDTSDRVMVFTATFNNISVKSSLLVLLVEKTGAPEETYRPAASHWQTLSHNGVSSKPRHERDSNSYFDTSICISIQIKLETPMKQVGEKTRKS